MRVSANDIYRMAQRAADGAGAPPGLDIDAARAVEWLALAGLGGVAALVADLDAGLGRAETCRIAAEAPTVLDFAAASGLLVGTMAVEWVVTRPSARLRINGLVSPLGLLHAAAERAAEAGGIALVVGKSAAAHFPASGEPDLIGDWSKLEPGLLFLATGSEAEPLSTKAAPRAIPNSESLAAIRSRHLRHGIDVDDEIWRRLVEQASRILVPPSPISRARGAGAGAVDDND